MTTAVIGANLTTFVVYGASLAVVLWCGRRDEAATR